MYKAVVFDFDGTIVDTEQHLYEVINKYLKEDQVEPISIDFYRDSIGGAATELQEHIVNVVGQQRKDFIYHMHSQSSASLPIRPTIKALMEFLKQRHIPMAIATSSNRKDIMPTFKALGLDNYIEVVVGSEDVENVKPDPELYLTAVQRLNYSPSHCLAIEDSVNGATAAIRAGLDVIVNTNQMTEVQDFSNVDFVAKDVDADEIIEKFFTK
ncbi:HAD family hydrolase [Staphylococcus simiae]|uniref:HAD family hydrolase n=1 Tax=Staphylococcus simiae TaxID=308354 RepID=UPI001A962E15|nr:HAD family hydrolase [Staphylococcus simiae]MBO1198631.1 HAD family hydrolase [Staphylococcus simiae]MBO1200884.1 HAD family hydrolase [Staphylococcus simiae]MBO1203092.1 HAD family hydrolase [Staphylococcus simiae]MBO1211763.1 HAD family hydrolase [Staphylococcus simiae]MBO1229220.1 HAD family hydrolase [Staphylococcus simiae]